MYRVAIGWLVFRLTDSNSALGLMDFVASLARFLPFAARRSVVERLDLRKLIFRTQFCCMCIAFAFAFLTFNESHNIRDNSRARPHARAARRV